MIDEAKERVSARVTVFLQEAQDKLQTGCILFFYRTAVANDPSKQYI